MSKYNPEEYERNKKAYKTRASRYLAKKETKEKRAENQRRYRKNNGKKQYRESIQARKEKLKQQYQEYMSDKKCTGINCGYSDWRSLVWHHKNPSTKKNGVVQLLGRGHSWDTILKEISKCICLCHNCHNILHNHQSSP